MRRVTKLTLLLMPIMALGSSCGQLFKTGAVAADGMFATGEVQRFVAALRQVRGDNVRLSELSIYRDYIVAEVQDPAKPDNFDTFDYRNGRFMTPSPIYRFEGDGREALLFDPDQIAFDQVPELVKEIRTRAGELEGAGLPHIMIRRPDGKDPQAQISVSISGARKKATLIADQTGKVLDLKIS
jgi:hypothetical protein